MAAVKRISLILVLGFVTLWGGTNPAAAVRSTYIVIDYATGAELASDGADEANYPASLTKMMTLYLAFDALREGRIKLSTPLKVSKHAASMPPSKLGLKPGSKIRLEDAIRALAVKSANDIAVVVAEALGGSESRFAQQMTRTARAKGLQRTTFRNASGLPDSQQKTTARDMAKLARMLIADFPEYYAYFSLPSFTFAGRTFVNHNRLLGKYDGMDGLKTGYIRASGYNLAASARRDGRRIVGVVLGGASSTQRNALMVQVLDRGFARINDRPAVAVAAATPRPVPQPVPRTLAAGSAPAVAQGDDEVVSYAVQVGAFSKRAAASKVAASASKLLGAIPQNATTQLSPPNRGRTLYLARLVGFDRAGAEAACTELKRLDTDCFVVLLDPSEFASN